MAASGQLAGQMLCRMVREEQMSNLVRSLVITALLLYGTGSGRAQTESNQLVQSWNQLYMSGDWGGERTRLANLGLTFSFISVNDFLVNQKRDDANWSRVR